MYVDEPPKDGNIPDFNISKIDICPFRAYQRSFRLFQSDFSTDSHQRSRLLCFTLNDHTGQTGFKICPFLKWAHLWNSERQSEGIIGLDFTSIPQFNEEVKGSVFERWSKMHIFGSKQINDNNIAIKVLSNIK